MRLRINVTSGELGSIFGCESLTEIVIPQSVSKIEPSFFGGRARLKGIVVEQGNKIITINNSLKLFEKKQNTVTITKTSS